MPEFEVEGRTFDEAVELGLSQLKALWDRVGEKPLQTDRDKAKTPAGELKRCWASGTEVYFDPIEHVYRDTTGVQYLGGSTFAHRYTTEFPSVRISNQIAKKWDVDATEVRDMWSLNADASSLLGSAVHAALQLRQQYGELSKATKEGSLEACLTKNPVLRPIVDSFFEGREDEVAVPECFVADAKRKHAGMIDRLLIEDDGLTVEDYKTNTDVHDKETIKEPFKDIVPATSLGAYWLQLSFYARILIAHGKTVKGLRVHHWTGSEWVSYDHEVIDLDGIIKAAKDE